MKNDIKNKPEEEKEELNDNSEAELVNLENQLKRALADYQNLERRISEEKRIWIQSANKDLVAKLLPVLDNLFLAQNHIQDEGLNLSIQKFLDILSAEGVERIKTKGEEFDPNTMECVTVQEGEENKVLEEVRAGFVMNETVLRPAQVIVGGKN
jgi:molecular chaperone GrpE